MPNRCDISADIETRSLAAGNISLLDSTRRIHDSIFSIRYEPGIFGVDSAESIAQTIGGYQIAVSEHQIVDEDLDHFNAGFADWVRQANPIVPSHADWVKMIQMYSVSRQDSMVQFLDLLDKYRLAAGKELTDPEAKFIRLSSSDYP